MIVLLLCVNSSCLEMVLNLLQ